MADDQTDAAPEGDGIDRIDPTYLRQDSERYYRLGAIGCACTDLRQCADELERLYRLIDLRDAWLTGLGELERFEAHLKDLKL